jgi:P4 family phage/plasmid primase-like protien
MFTQHNHIEQLRDLIGRDVVLLPVPRGEKGCRETGWPSFTTSVFADPAYQQRLRKANIAVLLGDASGGLCSIDIDRDDFVEPFLALNPELRNTLRTKRKRGCNLWLRVAGPRPGRVTPLIDSSGAAWGEWRDTGGCTMLYGDAMDASKGETEPTAYRIIQNSPPIQIVFAAIHWPDDLRLPWLESAPTTDDGVRHLIEKYGQPYYKNPETGEINQLNETFWAGLDAYEHPGLFEPDEREHYVYDSVSGLHVPITPDSVKLRIGERLLRASRQMNALSLERKRTARLLANIEMHLRGISERRGAFSQRKNLVHVQNGVIQFADDGMVNLLSFSPELISRNGSPIRYDPDAECPRFLNELLLPAVEPDDAILIQKYAGVCLYGRNIIQRMLILDGEAARGKTTLANVIQLLVGQTNCTQLRTRLLHERFEIFRFLRKTLLIGVDVAADFLNTDGAQALKGLVGGDYMEAEAKGSNGTFRIKGDFCVIVPSNSRLRVRLEGDVNAWRRRLLIVRFESPPPPKKIPEFAELLIRTEGPGILRWALEGLALVRAEIAEHGDIVLTGPQKGRVDSLLSESDSLRFFLKARLEKMDGEDITTNELKEAYAEFCPTKGWNPLPITVVEKQLKSLMLELFGVTDAHDIRRDGRNNRGFRRIHFIPEPTS